MDKETMQQYTLRITQANKTQMVVIIYEILLEYIDEARQAIADSDMNEFHDSIRRASNCIRELISSINFDVSIAGNLLSLYVYCSKELAKADIHHSAEELYHVEIIINKLYEASKEVASKDTSSPVMGNTEPVYAGLTYGKESLVVNLGSNSNRGFTV